MISSHNVNMLQSIILIKSRIYRWTNVAKLRICIPLVSFYTRQVAHLLILLNIHTTDLCFRKTHFMNYIITIILLCNNCVKSYPSLKWSDRREVKAKCENWSLLYKLQQIKEMKIHYVSNCHSESDINGTLRYTVWGIM